jgi:hypothetical protein
LEPYTEADAAFFFGREADRQIITANLHASRLTVLYGASGVGKSSVLQAAVVRRLHDEPKRGVVVLNKWHNQPLLELKQAVVAEAQRVLLATAGDGAPAAAALGSAALLERPLDEVLHECAQGLRGPLVVILDQFEEYFLYPAAATGGPGSFASELARAVNLPGRGASFLLAIREDALAKLDRFEERIPALFDSYLRVEHLDHDGAAAAITGPLGVYNQRVPAEQQVDAEPQLVEAVIEQVRTGRVLMGAGGRGALPAGGAARAEVRVEAPYLQLVLTRLWQEEARRRSRTLRASTLAALGGAERIVRTHLDGAMAHLGSGQQEVAAHVLRYLVTPSGSKIALSATDLESFTGVPARRIQVVLDRLADRSLRVIRPVSSGAEPAGPAGAGGVAAEARYEIFHDVLGPAILDWRARYFGRLGVSRGLLLATAGVALALLAIQVLPALPPLVRTVVRAAGLLLVNTAPLVAVYRWFSRYVGLATAPLAIAAYGGPNLGLLLGALFSALWYVLTEWPAYTGAGAGNPLAALTPADYLIYQFVVMLTVIGGVFTFLVMRAAGQLTYQLSGRFALGYYGTYLGVCVLVAALIVLKVLGALPPEVRITFA